MAVHVSAQCRMYMCRGSCPVVLCAVHSALTDRESESPTLTASPQHSAVGTSHPQVKHSRTTVVDGVTDGRYIARRTEDGSAPLAHCLHLRSRKRAVSFSWLDSSRASRPPMAMPMLIRQPSGAARRCRALQGAAGRPDSAPGPHAASWRTPPQQSATPHSALHAALNHALATQPSTPGPSFDAPC